MAKTTIEQVYDGLPMPQRIFAILTVSIGVAMAVMDVTITNVALPSMAKALLLSNADSIWIVNSYQLAIIMFLLAMSSIGEIYSYRKTYMFGLSVFTLASLCCGLSNGFYSLVISRLLQGLGASAMMSINMTLLRLSYPKRHLGKGIGFNATLVAIATVIAPSLAAGILAITSWRWLFLINIPLGIIAIIMGYFALPKNIVQLNERKFPKGDIILNAIFFGTLTLTIEGITHDFSGTFVIGLAIASFTVGFFYIKKELRMPYPLLPIDLMKIPLFSMSVLTSIASFTAQMLAMVSLPFFFQNTMHLSESESGLLFTAWPFAIIFAAPLAGSLIGKIHAGILGGIGLGLLTTGIALLAFLPEDASHLNVAWRMMICGAGFGLFQSPNNNILITSAPPSRSGSASGMLAMARLIGQMTGATLVALMFHLFNESAPRIALGVGACVAWVACLISLSRLGLKNGKE